MTSYSNETFRFLPTTGTFREVILAFLDILGFSETVLQAKEPDEVLHVLSLVEFSVRLPTAPQIRVKVVSDSILLCAEPTRQNLSSILNACVLLQGGLLKRGYLVRGSIVLGEHFSQQVKEVKVPGNIQSLSPDEVIVSKALIQAVREEKSLVLPNIKLSESVDRLLVFNGNPVLDDLAHFYKTEPCGMRVVNGLFSSMELSQFRGRLKPEIKKEVSHEEYLSFQTARNELETIYGFIVKYLNGADVAKEVKNKWLYIAREYNELLINCESKGNKKLEEFLKSHVVSIG